MTLPGANRFANVRTLHFGLELDADLGRPLAERDRNALRALFREHGLLVFRRQNLDHQQQIALMSCFGPILRAPDGIGHISTDPEKGDLGSYELAFHSDLGFSPSPYRAISLHAIDVVDDATSTLFASNRRGHDLLSTEMRLRLSGLSLVTAQPKDNEHDQVGASLPPNHPETARPPIISHPKTGDKLLYVTSQAHRFEHMDVGASTALIRELFALLYAPDNIHEHIWRNGDVVIWDNLMFQHARKAVHGKGPRTLQRVVVADKSFYELYPQFRLDDPAYLAWLRSNEVRNVVVDPLARER